MTQPEVAAGAIYDIGYQHYDGKRLGRPGAVRALYVQGVRTIFGLGRGSKAKIAPVLLIAFMIIPAIIQTAVGSLVGNMVQVVAHESYFRSTAWLFGLFCAFQTPELVTGDQQYRVLTLYFSRAVLRSDYVLARVAALASSLFAVALLPHVILLIGRWLVAVDVGQAIKADLPVMPRILAAALAVSILLSVVSLTIAAVIRKRPLATAAILLFFILANAVVTAMVTNRPDKMKYLVLASPIAVSDGVATWVFDTTKVHVPNDSSRAFGTFVTRDGRTQRFRRRLSLLRAGGPAHAPRTTYAAASLAFLMIRCCGRPHAPVPTDRDMLTVELKNVSKWYGNVVAVNDVSFTLSTPGVTGLLGPNGAGKSTILHMTAGLLQASGGSVTVNGVGAWQHPEMYRSLGFVPENEAVYGFLSGYEFALLNARLQGMANPAEAASRAIAMVEMEQAQHRPMVTYSKGMRQRAKIASALVHDPAILILDEPFNGMDPKQRLQMMSVLRTLADNGRIILVSSHILEEGRPPRRHRPRDAGWSPRGVGAEPGDPTADDGPAAHVHGENQR